MFNRREHFFQSSDSMFLENSCGYPFHDGYWIFSQSNCSHELRIYNVFDKYSYLRRIVISKEHMQPYISFSISLFQEVTCSDLLFLILS